MKYLKWIIRAVVAIVALIVAGFAGLFFYTLNHIQTPPVEDPDKALLSYKQAPLTKPSALAPWEVAARKHQRAVINPETFIEPPLKFGPWTRWWWPGNLVEPAELKREMTMFADIGIAGVEIQPFAVNVSDKDQETQRWLNTGWDSPEFYNNLHKVMETAKEIGMSVDLNNGSGWPTGGPYVALHDSMRQLMHSEILTTGPKQLDTRLPAPDMPVGAFSGGAIGMVFDAPMQAFMPDQRELVAVTAARIQNNQRTWQPWDMLDQITLDPDSVLDITDKVQGDQLNWNVPDGEWAITAFWQFPGGELISGGYAHPKPGYVVDHLDAERIRANQDYLFRSETGLQPYFGAPLRAFFNDSLEFKQERHWAIGHLQEFELRRGYDPRPWLSVLSEPGKDHMHFHAFNIKTRPAYDMGERGQRFLEDWALTTSDLFRERFFTPTRQWAEERLLAHRSQGYGGPVDIIRAAGESHIPETEQLYGGGSELFLKAVSSGAHIYDRPITTAESFVFVKRAYMTTPAKIKALADKAFVCGINQIIYHGTAYRLENPDERGYSTNEGWYPWQLGMFSTDFSEYWPYWEHAATLNRYIARNQYLLQMGSPETDVLVLYPGMGFPQGFTNPDEPFNNGRFVGEEPIDGDDDTAAKGRGVERMRALWRATRELERRGLTWEWVNEHAMQQARFNDGILRVGKSKASALMLHDIEALLPETAEHIAVLAEAGLVVQIQGRSPHRQKGLYQADIGDQRVRAAMGTITSSALRTLQTGPVSFAHKEIKSMRRRLHNGDIVIFFSNPSDTSATLTVDINEAHSQAVWLDAWHGTVETARNNSKGMEAIELAAYGSVVLWVRKGQTDDFPARPIWQTGDVLPLDRWFFSLKDRSFTAEGELIGDWLDIAALSSSGKQGDYSTEFSAPDNLQADRAQGHRWLLNLGQVAGATTVVLNGVKIGATLIPPYEVDVTSALKDGTNTLTVTLTPARKNRVVPAIENDETGWEFAHFTNYTQRVSAGLLGPVTVREMIPSVMIAGDVQLDQ